MLISAFWNESSIFLSLLYHSLKNFSEGWSAVFLVQTLFLPPSSGGTSAVGDAEGPAWGK